MAIEIQRLAGTDPLSFEVTVAEADGRTRHVVSLSPALAGRLAPGVPPEAVVDAAFRFLLDREPKEAILSRFDVSLIGRYFPEFESDLADYLAAAE